MPKNQLEEGQIVMCTVTKIVGTIVFVRIEEYNYEGTITFSEIFPGKIRNIRDFVFPGKKIVCKVLRINPHVIELSLRRVKVNERNDFNELNKKEKSYTAMFRTILGEKESNEAVTKIKENESNFVEFIESSKENPKILEKYIKKDFIERITGILKDKKTKETIVSKRFSLSSKSSNGIFLIKKIILESSAGMSKENLGVSYIAAGKYLIRIKTKDPKQSDQQLRKMLEQLELLSRKQGCIFNQEKD
jgi:translation initiation factor 2 alpha subunit (eIF-2alpha)